MKDLEDDARKSPPKTCPECGYTSHEMSSPTYNQTRCPKCGHRGDTRDFVHEDSNYDPWLPLERD